MFSLDRIGLLLQHLPRAALDKIVQKHGGDRYVKSFTTWQHLVAMVTAQISGCDSLREVETVINGHRNHLYHLGMGPVRRGTLSDANLRRDPEIFAELVRVLIKQAARALHRDERSEMLYLLDSTSIALRARGSEWTKAAATRTPGLKMHILFARHEQLPVHQSITAANVNDVEEGRRLPIQPGAVYVFDKGYCDYAWWSRIDAEGARFVTRLKRNAAVQLEWCRLPEADQQHILSDSDVRFTHRSNRGKHRNAYEGVLRRIEIDRPDDEPLVLVTNDLESPAHKVAELYKERWQIELFFKWMKQNLELKRFLGEKENAVRIQLLTALIAYLLVLIKKTADQCKSTLKTTLDELRTGLFDRPQTEETLWRKRQRELAYLRAVQRPLFR